MKASRGCQVVRYFAPRSHKRQDVYSYTNQAISPHLPVVLRPYPTPPTDTLPIASHGPGAIAVKQARLVG